MFAGESFQGFLGTAGFRPSTVGMDNRIGHPLSIWYVPQGVQTVSNSYGHELYDNEGNPVKVVVHINPNLKDVEGSPLPAANSDRFRRPVAVTWGNQVYTDIQPEPHNPTTPLPQNLTTPPPHISTTP